MNRPPLKRRGWVAASLIFLAASLSAQVCPQPLPTNFEGLNGNGFPTPDNQAILNVFTNTDSTDPINFDNTAHAALGETISIQFDDARVSAGQPFTLMFSPGVAANGLSSPLLDGTIWMNPAAVFPLIDGLGLFGFVNPFGSTAGPNNIYQVFANTGLNPANIGLCMTMQVAVFDPLSPAPYFLAISNPVALGFTPGITDLTPSVVAPGGTSTLSAPGRSNAGGDVITFPNGAAVVTGAGGIFSIPLSAGSGQVTVDIAGITSTIVPDSITDYLCVRSPVVNTIVGAMTLTPDPNLPFPNSSRGTGYGNLAPNGIDVWTVALNAGDVIEVEVFSTNSNWTKITDGLGATINPFATQGFDPIVSIEQQTNGGDLLLFDGTFAPTGPYLLHFDDNDGPENNSFLSWQAKTTGIYNLVVGDANPAAYVTGNYVLNVRRVTGVFPCVTQFVSTSNARINIVQQGGSITMLGANLIPGQFYDVAFFPLAGDPFTGRLATGIQCAVAGRLTVPIPASQFGNLPMGLHQVQLTNATTGAIGAVWDNTRVVQPFGPLPDILCIRGATRLTVTTNTLNAFGATPITSLNSQSLLYGPFPTTFPSTAQGDGYFEFTAPANLTVVYVEALGVSDVNFERFDSHQGLTNLNGIYNPTLQLYRPPDLLNVGPYNDDDGQVPSLLFPFSMGIGNSAAVIDFDGPAFFPNGGLYQGLLQELVVIGNPALTIPAIQATHYCLVNVAVL